MRRPPLVLAVLVLASAAHAVEPAAPNAATKTGATPAPVPAAAPSPAGPAPAGPAPAAPAPSAQPPSVDGVPPGATVPPDAAAVPVEPAPSTEPVPQPPPAAPPSKKPRTEVTPGEAPAITPARDTVGGHLGIGVHAGYFLPFGSFEESASQTDATGPGLGVGGNVAYGISRTVMLGLHAELGLPSGQGVFDGEDVSSLSIGPMIRYHLVQGTRFDPWLSFSVGYRRTKVGSESLTGVDWARVQLGGDWYAFSGIGFGPLVELSLGTFFDGTSSDGSKALNAHLLLGGRIAFDLPGK